MERSEELVWKGGTYNASSLCPHVAWEWNKEGLYSDSLQTVSSRVFFLRLAGKNTLSSMP